ncbi:8355c24e-8f1f-4e9f-a48d-870661dd9d8e-CDS [Sclerotinia trifoliorum]|uniref:8355c24e-8f1f-4e9f-a48d-870661dd9d8e-CDS n=1 Tax=Sclerotinia trifoliorum TaxID=28548 RepID=A0A8H2ZSE7_9HELO|nr:8355c24e-8f1f-4e9f-a48d-870661dd9d8e-CDS [Sclerotinia trifoliorum]
MTDLVPASTSLLSTTKSTMISLQQPHLDRCCWSSIYQLKSFEGAQIGQFILDGNLAPETNFDIARGWMNTCISEHSKSKCPSLDDKRLPSKVISVGAKDTDPFLILTNGAAASHKAADGILHNTTQRRRGTRPKLKLSKDSGPDDVVEIVGANWEQEDLRSLVSSGPLQSRAWTLQEKIFSPRTLWYGHRQIYWQCLRGYQSAEGNPSSNIRFTGSGFDYSTMTQKIIHSKSYSYESPNISKIELSDINSDYRGDKLPAFSSIAALIHQTIGGHYLAGVWSEFF